MNDTIRNDDLTRLIRSLPDVLSNQERLLRESLAVLEELQTAFEESRLEQLADIVRRQRRLAAELEQQRQTAGEICRCASRYLAIDARAVCLSVLIQHAREPERSRLQKQQRTLQHLAESCRQAVEQIAGGIFSRLEFVDRLLTNLQVGSTLRSYDSHGRLQTGLTAPAYERQG